MGAKRCGDDLLANYMADVLRLGLNRLSLILSNGLSKERLWLCSAFEKG